MTTWAHGTTRGDRKARADALADDNYTCQIHLPGCTEQAATAITKSGQLESACPHCIDQAEIKPHRAPRKRATNKRRPR